jgi:zinc transport system substrate-binding protein
MKMSMRVVIPLLALVAGAIVWGVGQSRQSQSTGPSQEPVSIVTTTSLVATIVEELGGDLVEVTTIVPAGVCPGHIDLKPREMVGLAQAKLVLAHGWEGWLSDIASVVGKEGVITSIPVEGNWMVPQIHLKAVSYIETLLVEVLPQKRESILRNVRNYRTRVLQAAQVVQDLARKSPVGDAKVVGSVHQADFLRWLGLTVVGTYDRPSEMNPRQLASLTETARREGVSLVVDNLQSGPEAGLSIARDLGIGHVALTNFPRGSSYPETLRENARLVIDGLSSRRDK